MAVLSEEAEARKIAKKAAKKRRREELAEVGGDVKSAAKQKVDSGLHTGISQNKKKKKSKGVNSFAAEANKDSTEDLQDSGSILHLKKRKKEGKADLQVPAELLEQPAEASNLRNPSKKKKKKKQKNGKDADTENENSHFSGVESGRPKVQAGAPKWAKVGSREAAAAQPPITKCLYKEHPATSALSDAEITAFREEHSIAVQDSLRPVQNFQHTGLSPELLHATRDFKQPSPIQAQCLPIALSGRDVIGIAATGSGKTLAFGLPCLRHIKAQPQADGKMRKQPQALVLSPTRELAQQIAAVMEEAGKRCQIRTLCAYGGVPKQPQLEALRKGVEIVVATPGRLEDLMQDGACRMQRVSYLVLDEADRMLDLGFEPHIRAIASETRADRQTLMFSATWPSEVQKLAMEYLVDPARVTIGSPDLSASHSVTQIVEVVEPLQRPQRLLQLLGKYHSTRKNRILVFVLYKKEATRVELALQNAGWQAASIHGDISQALRSKAVSQFKTGQMPLLVATDVAARGLDIPDVEVVINYSFPLTTEDYVHRIGRTGRAGKSGVAHTFFSGATDKARSGELINVLREAGQPVPDELLKFGVTTKKKESKLYGAHFKEIDPSQKATKIIFDD